MADSTYPPIKNGTRVRTTRENPQLSSEWTKGAKKRRRWGVVGTVIGFHDSHGLCYDVQHDENQGVGCYDPSEIEVVE